MKPKFDLDLEVPASIRRWHWPIRSIGQLMIVVALSGMVFAVLPLKSRRPGPPALKMVPAPGTSTVIQGPIGTVHGLRRDPSDRFVFIAPEEIDPGMVIQARPDLDEGMVFTPYGRDPATHTVPRSR
jgi:hypothetical protein